MTTTARNWLSSYSIATLFVVVTLRCGVAAEVKTQQTAQSQFAEEMQQYFRHPDPSALIRKLAALPAAPPGHEDWPYTLGAFLSQLVNADLAFKDALLSGTQQSSRDVKQSVILAMEFSRYNGSGPTTLRLTGHTDSERLIPTGWRMERSSITQPLELDMMWACFFASGNYMFIDRIAETMQGWLPDEELATLKSSSHSDPSVEIRIAQAAIADAAVWSLQANIRAFPEVRSALKAFAAHRTGDAGKLASMIASHD